MTNNEKLTLVITFNATGSVCYLSHREMATVFQRGLVRAGIEVAYSLGFNPRIRMSLPLPRTVGVESNGDVLCVVLAREAEHEVDRIRQLLAAQLPDGCEITDAIIVAGKCTYQPSSAVYGFSLGDALNEDSIKSGIERLREVCDNGEQYFVERYSGKQKAKKKREVGAYLSSVELAAGMLNVKCRITSGGSIRVEEIMELLGIEQRDLAKPVVRNRVEWSAKSA